MTFLSPHPDVRDLEKAGQDRFVYFDGLLFSPAAYFTSILYATLSTLIFYLMAEYFFSWDKGVSAFTVTLFSPVVSVPIILIYGTLVHYVLFTFSQKNAWLYVLAGGLPFLYPAISFDQGGYSSGYDPVSPWLFVNYRVLILVPIGMISAYGFYRGLKK